MKTKNLTLPVFLTIILILCCCVSVILSAMGIAIVQYWRQFPTIPYYPENEITPTPMSITQEPVGEDVISTIVAIEETIVPVRDLVALACRFNNICNVPSTIAPPLIPYTIGSQRQFWLNNSDTGIYSEIAATLHYITPHAYFWVEDGVYFKQSEAEDLLDTFEADIYPTNRAFFGSEWTPGIDNDPHIYIIYAGNLGSSVAGYFISLDEYNPLVENNSNAIEAFYIDSSQNLGGEYVYGTLAHEFQHMIHWYQDMNESSFLDEGFAELASHLNGYSPGGFDTIYASDPDIILTDWGESGDNGAHYGGNFLFVAYFLDRFGEQVTQALIHNPKNELESVDDTLQQLDITDPLTGEPVSADDFFLDWVITNYIHDNSVSDGRYYYHIYPDAPKTRDTEVISDCPTNTIVRTVNQYGVDYLHITCTGNFMLEFTGATTTPLLPINPYSGKYAFWSHKNNESNTSLQREFDFSSTGGPITLTYWTWFDLETDYDYVYLEASTDGENWSILITPSGTAENRTGSAYGWGYTGQSGGWIQETVDLSEYAGEFITLRFDYITDAAVNNEGFLLDDISIQEIGYSEDFEMNEGEWIPAGFVRVQNKLPQTYSLALIREIGSDTSVEILSLESDQTLEVPIQLGSDDDMVLVVTATTRITHEPAPYQIIIR